MFVRIPLIVDNAIEGLTKAKEVEEALTKLRRHTTTLPECGTAEKSAQAKASTEAEK